MLRECDIDSRAASNPVRFADWAVSSVLPDANKNATVNALVGAAFGAAGQRCMALSALVLVGEAKEWLPEIVEKAKQLKVDGGFEEGADLGPVISPRSMERIESLIQSGVDEGATLLLDGRGYKPAKYPNGNFVSCRVVVGRSTLLNSFLGCADHPFQRQASHEVLH